MPFSGDQITVTTTPQLVYSAAAKATLWVRPGGTLYLGANNSVSSSNGFIPQSGVLFEMELETGDEVWAVRSTGTTDLQFMAVTK